MVKYQEMREEIIDTLKVLSDKEYQKKVWVKQQFPEDIEYDSFDLATNILFDDTFLADDPEKEIGQTLRNKRELEKIVPLIQAIDAILNKLGTEKNDLNYISDPDWDQVVQLAKVAFLEFNSIDG